jgi:hypothetical protein
MDNVCFVSVALGERYVEQQVRLKESILAIYPEANLLFFTDELPKGSKSFYDSLYGFKPYAVLQAIEARKCDQIIWCDTAMILMDEIDDLFKYEIMAVQDDNKLSTFISDRYLKASHITRDECKNNGWHLVGGSLYYFDFDSNRTCDIFAAWMADERRGLFGSQEQEASEQLQGHRGDETCMAMNLYLAGMKPVSAAEVRYNVEENPMWIKKHFK